MASVLGNGPLGFTTSNGAHVIVPLGAISFDAKQIVIDNGWAPPSGMTAKDAKDWASYLLDQGELAIDAASVTAPTPPGPAFLVAAVHPGDTSHSAITLTVANANPVPANPPSTTSYKLDVVFESTYSGLTLETIAEVIGTSVDGGSQPGLVHLGSPPASPLSRMPDDAQTVDFVQDGAVRHAKFVGTGNDAFLLEAPGDGGGAALFNAVVTVTSPTSFDLKVTWQKSNTGNTAAKRWLVKTVVAAVGAAARDKTPRSNIRRASKAIFGALTVTPSQGIVVAGAHIGDLAVTGNVVHWALQGIHIGASEKTSLMPLVSDRAYVSGNSVTLPVPIGTIARHGIFVGNCRSPQVADNRIDGALSPIADSIVPEGIRLFGFIGAFAVVRANHISGLRIGINFNPVGTAIPERPQWIVTDNLAERAQEIVATPNALVRSRIRGIADNYA
jgi:hypothetical protein